MLGPTNKCTEAAYRSVHFWHQKADLFNLCSPVEALQRPHAVHGIPLYPTRVPQWHILKEKESTKQRQQQAGDCLGCSSHNNG